MNNLHKKDNKVVVFPTPNNRGGNESSADNRKLRFTMITDEMMHVICRTKFSDQESRVFHAVALKTIRYGKITDWIAPSQIEVFTGISRRHVSNTITKLINRKIMLKEGKEIGINPNVSEWLDKSKLTQLGSQNTLNKENNAIPKQGTNVPQTGNEIPQIGYKNTSDKCTHYKRLITEELKDITHNYVDAENINSNSLPVAKQKKQSKKRTSTPEYLEVTQELFAWAKQNQISVDLISETENFLDYHRAKGSLMADWTSAWRTWMRNSKKFSKPAYQSTQSNSLNDIDWDDTSWGQDLGL